MTESNLGPHLLNAAGLTGAALPSQSREAIWKRVELSNRRLQRSKRWALYCVIVMIISCITLLIARNGPQSDEGLRFTLTQIAGLLFPLSLYGALLLLFVIAFQLFSMRSLEIAGRMANVENLLESVALSLQHVAQRLDDGHNPPMKSPPVR